MKWASWAEVLISINAINQFYLVYRLNVIIGFTDMDYLIKTPDQLGSVLKGFRRDRDLTQAQVGGLVGLPQNAISEIEADPGRTSVSRVFKLLAALDLDLVVRPRQRTGKKSDW